jgi:hypothetical protein
MCTQPGGLMRSVIAHAKTVHAVCADPFYGWRLASAAEDGTTPDFVRELVRRTVLMRMKRSADC